MPRRRRIPAAVHQIIIRLSSLLRNEDISAYTGVSLCSVERILRYFKAHGTIQVKEDIRERKRRHLRPVDVEVSYAVLELHLSDLCIVSIWHTEANARHVSGRDARDARNHMWSEFFSSDAMAGATQGRLYSQKGVSV
jgi:hypothetical protein